LQAKIPANRIHQRWMLDRMKDLILPPHHPTPMGVLGVSDYERVGRELKDSGLIKKIPAYNSFFVGCDSRVEK